MKKKIVSIVLAILVLFSFSGCIFGKAGPELEYGDFVYCYVDDAKSIHREFKEEATGVNIFKLTKEGQKKETIIIPESIDGLPVIAIGRGGLAWSFALKDSNPRYSKIYLPTTLQYVHNRSFDLFGEVYQEGNVAKRVKSFLINIPNEKFFLEISGPFYIPEGDYSKYEPYDCFNSERAEKYPGVLLNIANLTYIVDEEVYWIDDYENGEYVVFPQAPTKDGFVFDGWYKEQECINEWQEATDTYSKSEEVKTVNLYAKWIESE